MAFKPIKIVIDGIDKLTGKLEGPMKKLDKMSRTVGSLGKALTIGVTLPIVAAGAASLHFANDLNAGMANVATLIPENTARVLDLKKSVQGLAVDMGKTTGEVAGGLYTLIGEFGDSAETAKKLEINTKAAAAGLSTIEEAITFTSVVTKNYGDTSVAAMKKVNDLGFKAASMGIPMKEMSNAIGGIAPLASDMGISLEELFGTLATAEDVTGNVGTATSQLSGVLGSLLKPSKDLQNLFEYLGYSSGKAMVQELGLSKSLSTIVGMAEKANVPLGKLIKRKEGIALASKLAGERYKDLTSNIEAMSNAAGSLDKAFAAQTKGINATGFTMAQATARIEVLAQKFGDRLAPAIMYALDKVTPFLDWLTKMKPEAMTTIMVLGGIAAAVGPLLFAFASVVGLVVKFNFALAQVPVIAKLASTALSALGGVLKFAFANPIGLAILAVGLLIYNISLLVKNWDSITAAFSSKFMLLQTMNFFFADIAKSIGHIIAFIPGLGKLADFFNMIGKGFEKNTGVLAEQQFGGDKLLPVEKLREKYGSRTANMSKSEILVKFGNLPKGVRIERSDDNVGIETEYGSSLAAAL